MLLVITSLISGVLVSYVSDILVLVLDSQHILLHISLRQLKIRS